MIKMKKYLSNNRAKKYILFLAQHGNYYINYTFNNIDDVRKYYKQFGIDSNEEINKTREYGYNPKKLTNFLTGNFHVISEGGNAVKTSLIDVKTNHEVVVLRGDGEILSSNHWDRIISSRNSFDRSIGMNDINLLNEAITLSIFGIEAYVNQKAFEYNKTHTQKLIDSKQNKVSLENKLIDWPQRITEKVAIDRGNSMWAFFLKAIEIRDQDVVHQKHTALAFSQNDYIHRIKIYRKGPLAILQTLIDIFDEKEIP